MQMNYSKLKTTSSFLYQIFIIENSEVQNRYFVSVWSHFLFSHQIIPNIVLKLILGDEGMGFVRIADPDPEQGAVPKKKIDEE